MEQRNNLVLHGTETFSRGALGQCGAGKRRGGAGFLRRPLPALRQLYHPGVRHAGLLQPECQLERQRPPQHHGRGALPVYAGNTWTGWLSFGKWAPDYPRCSIKAQSEDGWCS